MDILLLLLFFMIIFAILGEFPAPSTSRSLKAKSPWEENLLG